MTKTLSWTNKIQATEFRKVLCYAIVWQKYSSIMAIASSAKHKSDMKQNVILRKPLSLFHSGHPAGAHARRGNQQSAALCTRAGSGNQAPGPHWTCRSFLWWLQLTDQPALTVAKVQNSRVGERKEDEQSRVAAGAGKKQDLSKEHAITQSRGRKVSFRV